MRSPLSLRLLAVLLAALPAAAACGGSPKPGAAAPSPGPTAAPARTGSDVIPESALRGGDFRDVYQAVERLRPQFLRSRGTVSARRGSEGNFPIVFLDEQRLGALSTMRGLPVENVREIRYVAARDATTRWGTGYTAGVILVVTRVR